MPSNNFLLKGRREGGKVERCHMVPHFGSYTNAHHTWNVVQIILTFHHHPSLQLIRAAMDHDVVERWAGDMPATAKWIFPEAAAAQKAMEQKLEDGIGYYHYLTAEERHWLNAADTLEIWMWGLDQVYMGNRNAQVVVENVETKLRVSKSYLPAPLQELHDTWTADRLPDLIDLSAI